MRQLIRNIKHAFLVVTSNKPRYILTSLGIIIAIIIYTAGSIIASSFGYKDIAKYEGFDRSSVYVSGASYFINDIVSLDEELDCGISYYSHLGAEQYLYKNNLEVPCDIIFNILGANRDFQKNPLPSVLDSDNIINSRIIKGRSFVEDDYKTKAKVLVLNELFCDMFFGNGNGIGETIVINDIGYIVVGILENTQDIKQLKKVIESNNESSKPELVTAQLYVPNTYEAGFFDKIVVRSNEDINTTTAAVKSICAAKGGSIYTYNSLVRVNMTAIKNTQLIMQIVLLLLIAISASSIAVSLTFSIKERISEIGIKKAIGATNSQITTQFLIESIFTAILTGIIGIVIGVLVAIFVILISGFTLINFGFSDIFLPFLVNLFLCILSSLIPSYIASKCNIVKALRFE